VASFNESQVELPQRYLKCCGEHGPISPAFVLPVFMNAAPTLLSARFAA
jgi:hypothetical protein